jgi:hypothetical protein
MVRREEEPRDPCYCREQHLQPQCEGKDGNYITMYPSQRASWFVSLFSNVENSDRAVQFVLSSLRVRGEV